MAGLVQLQFYISLLSSPPSRGEISICPLAGEEILDETCCLFSEWRVSKVPPGGSRKTDLDLLARGDFIGTAR